MRTVRAVAWLLGGLVGLVLALAQAGENIWRGYTDTAQRSSAK